MNLKEKILKNNGNCKEIDVKYEEKAIKINNTLDSLINQAKNEKEYDNSISSITIEEIETEIQLAEEIRQKIELDSTVSIQLRFNIQKAKNLLLNK